MNHLGLGDDRDGGGGHVLQVHEDRRVRDVHDGHAPSGTDHLAFRLVRARRVPGRGRGIQQGKVDGMGKGGKVRDEGEGGMIQDGEVGVEGEGKAHDEEVEGEGEEGTVHGVEGDCGPANLQECVHGHRPRAGVRSG